MYEFRLYIRKNGSKFWYMNGVPHREDGPAIEWPDGTKSYYVRGIKLKRQPIVEEKESIELIFGRKAKIIQRTIEPKSYNIPMPSVIIYL